MKKRLISMALVIAMIASMFAMAIPAFAAEEPATPPTGANYNKSTGVLTPTHEVPADATWVTNAEELLKAIKTDKKSVIALSNDIVVTRDGAFCFATWEAGAQEFTIYGCGHKMTFEAALLQGCAEGAKTARIYDAIFEAEGDLTKNTYPHFSLLTRDGGYNFVLDNIYVNAKNVSVKGKAGESNGFGLLISKTSGSTLNFQNITIDGSFTVDAVGSTFATYRHIGVVAGTLLGATATFDNIVVNADLTCKNVPVNAAAKTGIGGIAGYTNTASTINNCQVTGNIKVENTDMNFIQIDGIVGFISNNNTKAIITNCEFTGDITPANKAALNTAITEADALIEDNYESGWAEFASALAAAKTVSAKATATQGEADTALANLNTAKNALVEKINREAIRTAISTAKALTEAKYTAETWAPLPTALATAESTLASSTNQVEIDAAANALNAAIAGLVGKAIVSENGAKLAADGKLVPTHDVPADATWVTTEDELKQAIYTDKKSVVALSNDIVLSAGKSFLITWDGVTEDVTIYGCGKKITFQKTLFFGGGNHKKIRIYDAVFEAQGNLYREDENQDHFSLLSRNGGNDFVLDNIYVNVDNASIKGRAGSHNAFGLLFSKLEGGTLDCQNITIDGSCTVDGVGSVSGGYGGIGLVAGTLAGVSATFDNIVVNADLICKNVKADTWAKAGIGGIVGIVNTASTINNCQVTGNIKVENANFDTMTIGGIVGTKANSTTITNCEFTGTICPPSVYAAALEVDSDIALRFYVPKFEEYRDYSLEVTFNGETYVIAPNAGTTTINGHECYSFTFSDISARYAAEKASVVLKAVKVSDESAYTSKAFEYSIKDYCKAKIEDASSTAELKALCSDILRYGDAVQNYMGDTASSTDGVALSAGASFDLSAVEAKLSMSEKANITWKSIRPTLDESIKITLNFEVKGENAPTKVLVNGNDSYGALVGNSVVIDSLGVGALGTDVEVSLYNGEDLLNTLTFTMAAYAKMLYTSGTNENSADLAQAMMNYLTSVQNYNA